MMDQFQGPKRFRNKWERLQGRGTRMIRELEKPLLRQETKRALATEIIMAKVKRLLNCCPCLPKKIEKG